MQQKEGATQVANKMMSIIGQMKDADPLLPQDIQQYEANTYNILGNIAYDNGTKESAEIAVEYFEKCRDICEEIGDSLGTTTANSNLAHTIAKYEEDSKVNVEHSEKSYKQHADQLGRENTVTINSGVNLAITLRKASRGVEAERLLTELVAISMRVHGQDHKVTKRAELNLQYEQLKRQLRLHKMIFYSLSALLLAVVVLVVRRAIALALGVVILGVICLSFRL